MWLFLGVGVSVYEGGGRERERDLGGHFSSTLSVALCVLVVHVVSVIASRRILFLIFISGLSF